MLRVIKEENDTFSHPENINNIVESGIPIARTEDCVYTYRVHEECFKQVFVDARGQ